MLLLPFMYLLNNKNLLIYTENYESREARKTSGRGPDRWKGRSFFLRTTMV